MRSRTLAARCAIVATMFVACGGHADDGSPSAGPFQDRSSSDEPTAGVGGVRAAQPMYERSSAIGQAGVTNTFRPVQAEHVLTHNVSFAQVSDVAPLACASADLSVFDRTCATASDCTTVTIGLVCGQGCACGPPVLSLGGIASYEVTLASLSSGASPNFCSCPTPSAPQCVQGRCQ
jgi:hypothetical protein